MSELQSTDHYFLVFHTKKSDDTKFSHAVSIKQLATLIARLALQGYAVDKGRSRDFSISTRGITHYCQDFEALKAFAQKVGLFSWPSIEIYYLIQLAITKVKD